MFTAGLERAAEGLAFVAASEHDRADERRHERQVDNLERHEEALTVVGCEVDEVEHGVTDRRRNRTVTKAGRLWEGCGQENGSHHAKERDGSQPRSKV
ncbi:DUF2563 family protein [Haladaptatus sp. CMSO5]|uniref:DUF2563 family protein n=1 Tax=Haladaptatus sp. CMSO5 TaxID=3120514 RepID=UPI003FA56985